MNNKVIFSILCFFCLLFAANNLNCSEGYAPSLHAERAYRSPDLVGYVFSRHWDCDSFLIRYSPYRNLMGVLMIDKTNNGYILEIFNVYTKQKVFNFEPMTMPISDFRLNEDNVIVYFSDVYGTQIAYDVYTGEVLWSTS